MASQRILLLSDLHYCQEEYGGISRDENAQRIIRQINEEHQKAPNSARYVAPIRDSIKTVFL